MGENGGDGGRFKGMSEGQIGGGKAEGGGGLVSQGRGRLAGSDL